MRSSRLLAAFAPSVISMLVACGDDGGGSGGSGATDAATTAATADAATTTTSSGAGGDGSSSTGAGGDEAVQLEGAVEKGPFILGSQITVSALDASLAPTGDTFETETTSDLGEFALAAVPTGPLAITGSGFYYNEVLGELSSAELTLRALFVPSGGGAQTAYVNIVTHLTKLRVEALVADGATFEDAVAQAEQELQDELAITLPSFDARASGVEMNIAGGDTDANAYLFAVSSVLVQVVLDEGEGSVEARLQELLNAMASELADGSLASDTRARVAAALPRLRIRRIAQGFAARLEELALPPIVPDMNRVLDQDGDGIVNIDDVCALASDPDQEDVDDDGRGDACDDCPETDCATDCVPAAESATGSDACVDICEEDVDCLFGETCTTLGTGGIGDVTICAEACDPGDQDCPDGEICIGEGDDGVCQPRGNRPQGRACDDDIECEEGLICWAITSAGGSRGVCQAPCESEADCGGADCSALEGSSVTTCELPAESGMPCRPEDPDACGDSFRCALGGDVDCEVGIKFCCKPAGGLGEGCIAGQGTEMCDPGLGCGSDLTVCDGGPVPDFDVPVCCAPGGEQGQPCLEDYACDPGFTCYGFGPEVCAGWLGCCLDRGALNQICDPGQLCDAGLECVYAPGECDFFEEYCCRPVE